MRNLSSFTHICIVRQGFNSLEISETVYPKGLTSGLTFDTKTVSNINKLAKQLNSLDRDTWEKSFLERTLLSMSQILP